VAIDDEAALAALSRLGRSEGILVALETAHALAALESLAREDGDRTFLVNLSGRGDKDMATVMARAGAGG
jgi:tryptophan synthase beta chain